MAEKDNRRTPHKGLALASSHQAKACRRNMAKPVHIFGFGNVLVSYVFIEQFLNSSHLSSVSWRARELNSDQAEDVEVQAQVQARSDSFQQWQN